MISAEMYIAALQRRVADHQKRESDKDAEHDGLREAIDEQNRAYLACLAFVRPE